MRYFSSHTDSGTTFYQFRGITRLIVFPRQTYMPFAFHVWAIVWWRIVFAPFKPKAQ
jgi:hypothetical protein